MKNINFTIITFYQFKKVKMIHKVQKLLREFCTFHKIKGTIILAEEGINGTLAGLSDPISLLEKKLKELDFIKLEKKISYFDFMPFTRLKIKIKKEIVTFNETDLDVAKSTGKHVSSFKWNSLINEKETIVIDVRNDFEFQMGSFKRSINPVTNNFSDFKKFVQKDLIDKKNKKIAIFCTGGIRCEKASSYMLKEGFEDVFQLKGGILKYLQDVKYENSEWQGECFVFDNRVSIQNNMIPGTYELCHACRNPISISDRKTKSYNKGISCPKCINKISKEKLKKLRDRTKQIETAKKKGLYNPYIKYTPSDIS